MRKWQAVITVFSALALGVFMFAPSAGAITRDTQIEETFGGGYSVYTGGSTDGNVGTIGLAPGRDFGIVYQNAGYNDPSGKCSVHQGSACAIYVFYAGDDPSTGKEECLASSNSGARLLLKPCSGSNGVNWAWYCPEYPNNCQTHAMWINDYYSSQINETQILSGDTVAGDQLWLDNVGTCELHPSDCFQKWDWSHS